MKKITHSLLMFMIVVFQAYSQYVVEGTISDSKTGEGLPGAYITTNDRTTGAIADQESRFLIKSDVRIDSITVTFIGYKTLRLAVNSAVMNIKMDESSNELNQVVVSAQRENQSRVNAPIAVALLPAKVIDDTRATEISQLLNKVSGILISDFGAENHSVSIRQPLSFIRTQIVTLEDEIPINPTTIATSGNLKEINLTAVRSIEVLKGPASSIYGSEAIGGTINFITKRPTIMPMAEVSMQANNMGYRRADLEAGTTIGKLGLYAAGYGATCSDTYRDFCDFRKLTFFLKGVYSFSSDLKLTTSLDYIRHNANLSGSLDSALFFTNDRYNQYSFCYSDLKSVRASARLDKDWSEADKTFMTLHYRQSFEDQIPTYYIQRVYGGPPPAKFKGEYIESGYNSYGLLIQHRHKFGFLGAQIINGLSIDFTPYDYISKSIDVTREGELYTDYSMTDTYVQDFNADLLSSAGYLLFEFFPVSKLKVTSALRYDRLDYNYKNNLPSTAISGAPDDRNTFDHVSPKLGVNYNLNPNLGIYANYSVGFAPPLFSQLYKAVKVPLLKPSNYNNYEVGGWWSFNSNKGYIDVSAYHSDGRNEIVSVILGDGTTQNQSAGGTRHMGIEYSLRYTFFNQIDLRINAANSVHKFLQYVNQKEDYSGNYMTLAPKFIANSEVTWRPSFIKNFRIGIEWEKVGKYWIDELNTREYKGYNLINVRTGYNFSGFSVWLNVLNAANDLYAVRVTKSSYGARTIGYVPGPRRAVFLGMGYRFGGKQR